MSLFCSFSVCVFLFLPSQFHIVEPGTEENANAHWGVSLAILSNLLGFASIWHEYRIHSGHCLLAAGHYCKLQRGLEIISVFHLPLATVRRYCKWQKNYSRMALRVTPAASILV